MSKALLYVLIICNLAVMIYLSWYVYNYKTLISSDPLAFGAKVHNIDTCSCVSMAGGEFYFNSTTVWRIYKNKQGNIQVYNSSFPFELYLGDKNGSV